MDPEEKFFPSPIDRTPYNSCGWLGFIVIGIFIASFVLLWDVAGAVKSFRLPHFHSISLPKSSTGENISDQIKQKLASPSPTASLKEQAEQKAKDALKEEAKNQIQDSINQAKDQYLPQ